jgi:DNA-binding YbaB/EbfC family protein
MFGKLGQIASLLGNLPRLQEDMKKFQESLGSIVAEGDAGAGAVKVRVNGRMEVLGCQLAESAMTGGDRELLEDLIKAATNQALQKVRQLVMEQYSKMFAGMGLPPGMSLPGVF